MYDFFVCSCIVFCVIVVVYTSHLVEPFTVIKFLMLS